MDTNQPQDLALGGAMSQKVPPVGRMKRLRRIDAQESSGTQALEKRRDIKSLLTKKPIVVEGSPPKDPTLTMNPAPGSASPEDATLFETQIQGWENELLRPAAPESFPIPPSQPRPDEPAASSMDSMASGMSKTLTSMLEDVINDDAASLLDKLTGIGCSMDDVSTLEATIRKSTPNVDDGKVENLTKEEKDFKTAIDSNQIDPRSGVGQRVMNSIKSDEKKFAEYRTLDRKGAAEYRMNFAKVKLANLKEARVVGQKWKRIDTTRGRYLPFSKMVREEGNDEDALLGCVKVVQKCMAMGHPWVHRHPQTERLEYLLLNFEWAEDFEQSWSTWKTHWQENISDKEGNNVQKDSSKEAKKAIGDKAFKHGGNDCDNKDKKGKAFAKPTAKGRSDDLTSPNKEDMNVQQWMVAANKLKAKLSRAMAGSSQLIDQIITVPSWSWADNAPNRGELERRLQDLKNAMTPFSSNYLVLDSKDMKRKTDQASWHHELKTFVALEPKVDALASWSARLTTMHQSTPRGAAA